MLDVVGQQAPDAENDVPQRCRAISLFTAVLIASPRQRSSHLRYPRLLSHSIVQSPNMPANKALTMVHGLFPVSACQWNRGPPPSVSSDRPFTISALPDSAAKSFCGKTARPPATILIAAMISAKLAEAVGLLIHQRGQGLAGCDLITFTCAPAAISPFFMGKSLEGAHIALRCDNPLVQLKAAANDVGIAELACFLGDSSFDLVRMCPQEAPARRTAWLIVHQDMRRSARFRAVSAAITEAFRRQRKTLGTGLPW